MPSLNLFRVGAGSGCAPVRAEVLFAEVLERERRVELVLRVVPLLGQEPVRVQHHHLVERPGHISMDSTPMPT